MTQLAITAIGLLGLLCTIGSILGLCWLAADLAVDGVRWARRRVRRGPSAVRSAGQVEDTGPEVVPAFQWPDPADYLVPGPLAEVVELPVPDRRMELAA